MQETEKAPYTFVEVVVEIKRNPTESEEKIYSILRRFLEGEIAQDQRFDGLYYLIRSSGIDSLIAFHEWLSLQQIIDTVRSRLFRSITGNLTAVYFNRQAAFMNHLALVDVNDSIPLGPVALQIVSDNIEQVIDEIAPKTYEGRIVTKEEEERILKKREQKRKRKQKERMRERERDAKLLEEY